MKKGPIIIITIIVLLIMAVGYMFLMYSFQPDSAVGQFAAPYIEKLYGIANNWKG